MKALRFTFVLLLLCSLPLCAFAMNDGYISDSTKWQFNNEVINMPEQRIDSYKGIYNYYSDVKNNCFYLKLSYDEDSLNDNGDNDIHLEFDIENSSNDYSFNIDESTNGKIYNAFEVHTDFGGIWLHSQDIYVGIEFLNKEDKMLNNYLSFSLVVNGNKYQLCDENIKLAYGDYAESLTTTKPTNTNTTKETATKETTTKPTTRPPTEKETATKQTTTQKETATKKETTTKFKYTHTPTTQPSTATQTNTATKPTEKEADSTTEKKTDVITDKVTSPKTESTTKFKYTEAATELSGEYDQGFASGDNSSENEGITEENTTAQNERNEAYQTESGIIIPEVNGTAERSPQTMLLTAAAVICAVGGGAVIARNALPQKKESNENDQED